MQSLNLPDFCFNLLNIEYKCLYEYQNDEISILKLFSDEAAPVKHIKFASPTESKENENDSDDAISPIPVIRCSGLTAEFDTLLVKDDLRSCMKRNQCEAQEQAGPNKKRVRLSSPINTTSHSSTDDEITFHPRAFFNSDSILMKAGKNISGSTANPEELDNPGEPVESPFSSPNGHSSGYGTCNISGVTTLTETTRMSIQHCDVDTESDTSFQNELNGSFLSPVGSSKLGPNTVNVAISSPNDSARLIALENSIPLSPMEIGDSVTLCNKFSSPVSSRLPLAMGFSTSLPGGSCTPFLDKDRLANGDTNKLRVPARGSGQQKLQCSFEADDGIELSLSTNKEGDSLSFEIDTPSVSSADNGIEVQVALDHVMQTPVAGSQFRSRMESSAIVMPSVFKTPANVCMSKVYRTVVFIHVVATMQANGCKIFLAQKLIFNLP